MPKRRPNFYLGIWLATLALAAGASVYFLFAGGPPAKTAGLTAEEAIRWGKYRNAVLEKYGENLTNGLPDVGSKTLGVMAFGYLGRVGQWQGWQDRLAGRGQWADGIPRIIDLDGRTLVRLCFIADDGAVGSLLAKDPAIDAVAVVDVFSRPEPRILYWWKDDGSGPKRTTEAPSLALGESLKAYILKLQRAAGD